MSMVDRVIKMFSIACWTAPLAWGASIFVRAYLAELRQGRNPYLTHWQFGRKMV